MVKLDEVKYEKLLKEPLRCHRCNKEQKNMPSLKADLATHHKKVLERHQQIERNGKGSDARKAEQQVKDANNELSLKRKASDLDTTESDVLSEAPPKRTATQSD